MWIKKSLPSQNVEKTILFISDIDRTLERV